MDPIRLTGGPKCKKISIEVSVKNKVILPTLCKRWDKSWLDLLFLNIDLSWLKFVENIQALSMLQYEILHTCEKNHTQCFSYLRTALQRKNIISDKNSSHKIVEMSEWCWNFCPTKNFVRQKYCPIFQYKSQAKIGKNCRNFGLVSKILSDEILSDKVTEMNLTLFCCLWQGRYQNKHKHSQECSRKPCFTSHL